MTTTIQVLPDVHKMFPGKTLEEINDICIDRIAQLYADEFHTDSKFNSHIDKEIVRKFSKKLILEHIELNGIEDVYANFHLFHSFVGLHGPYIIMQKIYNESIKQIKLDPSYTPTKEEISYMRDRIRVAKLRRLFECEHERRLNEADIILRDKKMTKAQCREIYKQKCKEIEEEAKRIAKTVGDSVRHVSQLHDYLNGYAMYFE